jgi:HAD superfamily hydrolase (TIGR01509 family)
MQSSHSPRAVFLDLDGTLADSIWVMHCAYELFCARHGKAPTDAEFQRLNGPPMIEIVRRLKVSHSLAGDERELLRQYTDLIDQSYADVVPFSDAVAFLDRAKLSGCQVAVVTSSSAERTQRWLLASGLAPFVDFVVSGGDVKRGKPDPEPYLRASELASCAVSNIVAVEDSPQGGASAIGAGLRTYAVARDPAFVSWPREAIPVASLAQLADLLW